MNGIDNEGGRRWARFTLVATLVVSVIANITHATLAASQITLWLRVPGAAIWPVLSFLAIEIIVRIAWARRWAHHLARVFVLGPAIPAVIVSYEHQQRLLSLMGESPIVQHIGPLAIDGLMIGCTLALLFTRETIANAESAESAAAEEVPAVVPIAAAASIPAVEPAAAREDVVMNALQEAVERKSAATPADLSKALEVLMSGQNTAVAAGESGLSAPTVRRYASVIRALKADPHAPIDCKALSVRPAAVDTIRAWARLESVR